MPAQVLSFPSYKPDLAVLNSRFRYWHTEALLNQAGDLVDRCLGEFREFRSLEFAWTQFVNDLENQEAALSRDKVRHTEDDPFGRDEALRKSAEDFIAKSSGSWQKAYNHANDLGKAEKDIDRVARNEEQALNIDHRGKWITQDKKYAGGMLDLREKAIKIKRDLSKPGQPLSFENDLANLARRLQRSWNDAVDRATVAAEGLRLIYDYRGDPGVAPALGASMDQRITDLAIWLRNAIQWLVAQQQIEQGFIHAASLRSLLGPRIWKEFEDAKDVFIGSFRVNIDPYTPGPEPRTSVSFDNVRLRGIAASMAGDVTLPWKVVLRPPAKAFYGQGDQQRIVDQSSVPPCLLGRVEGRELHRNPDVCGLISLFNISPFGVSPDDEPDATKTTWKIRIDRPIDSKEKFKSIDDIILEMHLVGIPRVRA